MFVSDWYSLCFTTLFSLSAAATATPSGASVPPKPGTHGHYAVLTAKVRTPPPFHAVDFLYGPRETVAEKEYLWWQLEVRQDEESPPLFTLRALTSRDPMDVTADSLRFERYLLRIPETDETFEYRNIHTGKGLLPPWKDFKRYFVPQRSKGCGFQRGLPETADYLGHILTLQWAEDGSAWEAWEDVKELPLDPELLVGTGRNFKDEEGHRLPQTPERRNYTYIPFIESDYERMIATGFNLFTIAPEQERFVRDEPVFYIRGVKGDPALRYPADLYRSNYLGSVMFMDEPAIIMVGDENVHNTLRYFSDAVNLLQKRVRERYTCRGHYSAFQLEQQLMDAGVNFGDMRLEQHDYPAWETIYETAYYQLRAGLAGIVHEGRYQLAPFDESIDKWTDEPREHTAEELLAYHYAFLRGGARAFGKDWGTAIYGQCDPTISPLAIKMAYDMGARYIWFWTSDHDHHMPWPEQLELVTTLRQHAEAHPRSSIAGSPPMLDTAIAVPYGYFLSLGNLWWVRVLDKEGHNEASQKYSRLMRRAIRAFHTALDNGETFDFTVDEGHEITGYHRVIRIADQE